MIITLGIVGGIGLIWLYIFIGRFLFELASGENFQCYTDWEDDLIVGLWPVFAAFYLAERQGKEVERRRIRRLRQDERDEAAWREFKGGDR